MLNLRARQYEPAQARFSQRDSLKGSAASPRSLNAYLYCQNDAVNFFDASGAAMVAVNMTDGGGGRKSDSSTSSFLQKGSQIIKTVASVAASAAAVAKAVNDQALANAQESSMFGVSSDPATVRHKARTNRVKAQTGTPTVRSTKQGACMSQEEHDSFWKKLYNYLFPSSCAPQYSPEPTPSPTPMAEVIHIAIPEPSATSNPIFVTISKPKATPTPPAPTIPPTPSPTPTTSPSPTRPSWEYYQGDDEGVARALDIAIEIQQNNTRKYQYGEWDCSGFVNTVLWNFFPRTTEKGKGIAGGTEIQYDLGVKLGWEHGTDMSEIQPGDLIYWWKATDGKYNHVAIYMGNGMIIDNSSEGDMSIRSIDDVRMKTRGREWLRPNYNN